MSRFRNSAILSLLLISSPLPGRAAPEDYRFELARKPEKTGAALLVKVRLVSVADGKPAAGVEIVHTQLDMGPDGMAAMTAPVKPLPASEPGMYLFEAHPTMAGNWALNLTAKVEGEPQPITGAVTIAVTQ